MSVTIRKLIKDYVDIDFTFQQHPTNNNLVVKKTINAIKQSINNLLKLKKGDKPFHPEIYSPIYNYLFENLGIGGKYVLEDEIRKYISTYEPRVYVNSVEISLSDVNSIICNIECVIIATEEPITLNILVDRLR